ncbi:C40 family peptidase [Streptacidiphilus sp. P02-A3a]|uniref:C40 family peptidase n=1 Tax=Streptacidiphilus sp. P02-A3a TaxID=2704468 RepID=UPI0015FC477C|nr:C40 family peptidase [Streptacidiphilus sp. P02-A3a]QMU67437.1 C40 family peptidase [Streptacidiphilus sp. P02-A3a]
MLHRLPLRARPGRVLLCSLLALALAGLPLTGTATADDPPPGPGDLETAQQTARQTARQVADVERQLAAAEAQEQDLDVRAEQAVERYDGATVHQLLATQSAIQAGTAAAQAEAGRQAARTAAGELAAEQYRLGVPSGLVGFDGVLQAKNVQDADSAREVQRDVDGRAQLVLTAATGAAARAAATAAAAVRASAVAAQAAAQVLQARQQVEAQLAQQRTEVAALDAQHATLLGELAAAEQVSLDLVRRRERALADAATTRAAVASRRAALDAPAPADSDAVAVPDPAEPDPAAAVSYARAQLGLPYVWGAAGPDTFDCSGLTMRAWERAGVPLPHYAADQYARSRPLGYSQLRPGDLVFWSHDGTPQGIYHVALYTGDDQIIEAPRTGAVVKTASLWIMGAPSYYARP